MMIRWTEATVLVFVLSSVMSDRVPVMMWSNDESVTFPAALAGHTIASAAFEKDYIESNLGAGKNLIVFVQNRLSVADISHYANVYGFEDEQDATFPNVKSLMSNEESVNLPNVLSPLSAFDKEMSGDVRVLESPYSVESLIHSTDDTAVLGVVLVKLPDVNPADRQNSLKANDKIIGEVVKKLEQHKIKYTAVYTAASAHKKPLSDRLDVRPGRQLLADSSTTLPSNTSEFWTVDDQVLLYLDALAVSNSSKSPSPGSSDYLDLSELKLVEEESHCSNDSESRNISDCFMTLHYTQKEPVENLTLKFSFMVSGKGDSGYWYLSALEISYMNTTDGAHVGPLNLDVSPIGLQSPMGFSYSCYEPDAIGPDRYTNKTNASPYLHMSRFQVQAFGYLKGGVGFGYHNDCQYFFGIGIWMALISLAVMIGILVFGLYMLFQITTMDRFDDPKGKTLIIAATE